MWGSLLMLALLTSINPVRLGLILLVLSRPRPILNLVAYWAGCIIVALVSLIVPLIVLHAIPTSAAFANNFANPAKHSNAPHIAIGVGVCALSIAALMVVRSAAGQRAHMSTSGGRSRGRMPRRDGKADTPTRGQDSNTPDPISRLLGPAQSAEQGSRSGIRQLLSRLRDAWENGSFWVSFVIGVLIVPPLDVVLFVLAIIVASGAAMSMQITAAVVFVIGSLAVEEVILVTNLVTPARTQAVLQRLHGWALTHRRKFVVAILVVVGVSMVARGMAGV
jgi:hypothetical protein